MKHTINFFSAAIKAAVEEAKKSDYRQKVGAVIVKKKTIISKGHNYAQRAAKKLHPKFQEWPNSIHAEVDCILKARTDVAGASIYVIRINNLGQFRLSKPCKHCSAYLKHIGIKKVFYSINEYPYIATKNI